MKWVLVLLLLTGCGSGLAEGPSELLQYAETFKQEARNHNFNLGNPPITLMWTDLSQKKSNVKNGRTVGVCWKGAGIIEIDPVSWKAMSPAKKELLMFHELGHCWLFKDHEINPYRIMYESLTSIDYYQTHREEELHYLFRGTDG